MVKRELKYFKSVSRLDKIFEAGLLLKLLDGAVEVVGALALLTIPPERVTSWVQRLTASELSEDPHDFIATTIVRWAHMFTKQAAIFAAVYLLLHGLVKLFLVYEVLRNHLWAYIALIIVTALFIIYQVIHLIDEPSVGFTLLTVFDFIIIYLTIREYGKQKNLRQAGQPEE